MKKTARFGLLADGDPMKAEFDRIYFETEGKLRGFLTGLMSDPHGREDCLQETYLRLWKQLKKAVPERPAAWLVVVARRLAMDGLSSTSPRDAAPEPSPRGDPGVESLAVAETIRKLPDDLRETFCLRHLGGLTYAEIAKEQGVPIGTVASRIHRAIEVLRQIILDVNQDERKSHEPR